MTEAEDTREVIASGKQPFWTYDHLVPIARFLIEERGHSMFPKSRSIVSFEWGFMEGSSGLCCELTRRITDEDWAAINAHLVLPDTIGYWNGLIRDNLNRIDIIGIQQMITEDGPIPIEEWEEQQRALGKMP